jgi:hypothetical protein
MFAPTMPVRIPDLNKPETRSRSIHLDLSTWERLAEIANEVEPPRSRNKLVAGILRDWVKSFDAGDIEPGTLSKRKKQ